MMPRKEHEIVSSLCSSQRRPDCGNPRCGFARIRCPDCRAEMIRKVYEADPMVCPNCGGTMKVIAFLTDYAVVYRIIDHLKLTFVAERPPPSHLASQEVLMAAEASTEYSS